MGSIQSYSYRLGDEILTKSHRMNGLKRQAPFKRQLLQIRLLTVLNYSPVQCCRADTVSFRDLFSDQSIKIKFKNLLDWRVNLTKKKKMWEAKCLGAS